MPTEELPERAPGTYVPFGQQPYYLPEELPPSRELGPEFHETLQDAIYQLGRLEGIKSAKRWESSTS